MYRVMIVDDEPFILDGLSEAVDWSAYGLDLVGRAENGRQALDKLREIPVDLLITDITMPIMNGLELIRSAREIRPELLVIILSGYNEFDYLRVGMQLGIENYLLKPVNFTELFSTLSSTVLKLNDSERRYAIRDDDIDIIKDNLMLRRMTGQIQLSEFEERAAVLGLRMDGSYVTTIIVRSESEEERKLYQEVKRVVAEQDSSSVCFRNLGGDIVIVYLANNHEECRQSAIACASSLQINKQLIYDCCISIGTTEERGAESISYESAQRAQQFFLLLQSDEIADYEQIVPNSVAAELMVEMDWDAYGKYILAKDTQKLLAIIENDFNRLRELEGMTPEQLRGLAMEMMVRLKIELDGLYRPGGQMSGPFQSRFELVARASELEELLTVVKETAVLTIEELVREDKSPVVRQVLLHIERHYTEDMTLKLLGQQYNIHPVYLGKLFHQETGDTFTEYVNRFRIAKAKSLLKDTSLKVQEISRQVGYWETGYFYKQFRKHVGISPTEFKALF
jgi:two-component system response regulator YesN